MQAQHSNHLPVGWRAPHDIRDPEGRLLIARGLAPAGRIGEERLKFAITSPHRNQGPFARQSTQPVFLRMGGLAARLANLERDFVAGQGGIPWVERLQDVAQNLMDQEALAPDEAFAALHLENRHGYEVLHHAMAGIVCARLARLLAWTTEQRHSLVAAALTHDLGMFMLRRELATAGPLTPAGRQLLHLHPGMAVRALRGMGVTDPDWLDAVLNHHEYPDGSGYSAMAGESISGPARLLGVADAFSAMLRPRPHRSRILAKDALAALYRDAGGRYEPGLVALLVREYGSLPPGSLVRLANGEVAVVLRTRPAAPGTPEAVAIAGAAGRIHRRALPRDTRRPETAVVSLLAPDLIGSERDLLAHCWAPQDAMPA